MIVVVVIWGFSFFLQALLAESYEFELVPEDPVLGQPAKRVLKVLKGIVRGFNRSIFNLPALQTGDVVMILDYRVKPHLGQPWLQPVDQPARGKNVEVAVNRSHTDSWKSFPDPLVDLIRRGMRRIPFDLFEDHLTLVGHPVFLIRVQRSKARR